MEIKVLKMLQDIGVDWTDRYREEMADTHDYIVCGARGCRGWSPTKKLPKQEEVKQVSVPQIGMYRHLLKTRGEEWMRKNHPDIMEKLSAPNK